MSKRKTLAERAAEARDELDWINAQLSAESLSRAIKQRVPRIGIDHAESALKALREIAARWDEESCEQPQKEA